MTELRALRRQQILASARTIVAESGLAGLTIGRLERALPFSRGVITHHFDNKDAILTALLAKAIEDIDAGNAVVEGGPEAQLRAVILNVTEVWLDQPEAARVMLAFWDRVQANPEDAHQIAETFDRWRSQAARLIRWGQEQGAFRTDRDPRVGAMLCIGTVIGVVAQVILPGDSVPREAAAEAAAAAVTSWLTP